MGYDHGASKRPVNLSLNAELVRRARSYTQNLSATLEELLKNFIAQEESRRLAEDETLAIVLDGLSRFHEQHGLLSDEFSSL